MKACIESGARGSARARDVHHCNSNNNLGADPIDFGEGRQSGRGPGGGASGGGGANGGAARFGGGASAGGRPERGAAGR